jgi:hypothetical protein
VSANKKGATEAAPFVFVLVIAGLDPAIHRAKKDGPPGQSWG